MLSLLKTNKVIRTYDKCRLVTKSCQSELTTTCKINALITETNDKFLLTLQNRTSHLSSSVCFVTCERHLLCTKMSVLNLPGYIIMHFLIFTQPGVFSSLLIFFNLYCRISLTNV